MHLLAAQPGAIADGNEAIDLGQTPGDIVVLSAADTELSLFARARGRVADAEFPSLRLASLLHLGHNMSVDLYVDSVIRHAKLVVVRLLGGRGYWPYGVDEILRTCCDKNIPVAFLPGDFRQSETLTKKADRVRISARARTPTSTTLRGPRKP